MGQSFNSEPRLRAAKQQAPAATLGLILRTAAARQPATLTFTQANDRKNLCGFLLSLEVSRLWLEEGQAVGSFFGSIRKLESHFFCTSQKVGEFEAEYLREGKGRAVLGQCKPALSPTGLRPCQTYSTPQRLTRWKLATLSTQGARKQKDLP